MIHLATASVVNLLNTEYALRYVGAPSVEFELVSTEDFPEADPLDTIKVTLYLYRVAIDPTKRHIELAPRAAGQPQRLALSLELHLLLTVWARSADYQQMVLARAMQILDEHAILGGDRLARPALAVGEPDPWEPNATLALSIYEMSHEDMLRLWDGLAPSYRLSIPYALRNVRLVREQPIRGAIVDQHLDLYQVRG